MSPWLAPINDNLQYLLGNGKDSLKEYVSEGIIEIEMRRLNGLIILLWINCWYGTTVLITLELTRQQQISQLQATGLTILKTLLVLALAT